MPKSHYRSKGSPVYYKDAVVLEAVLFDSFFLGAAPQYANARARSTPGAEVARVLRSPRTLEVSACMRRKQNGRPAAEQSSADNCLTAFTVALLPFPSLLLLAARRNLSAG